MLTHHLCDTRLAVPGVLSPGSCSNPGNNLPWPCRELLGLAAPFACAVSPPGPVDAPRCPSGFRALLGAGWGEEVHRAEELHRDPPPEPVWGCSSFGAPTPACPNPLSLRTQPPSPGEHMRSIQSAPQRSAGSPQHQAQDTAPFSWGTHEEHPISSPRICWTLWHQAPACPRAATAAPNPAHLNPK